MGEPIVSKMNKTIMKYIQANYTLQHLQNSRPEWTPDNSDIDGPAYDRWNARMRGATRRAANMKLLWDLHYAHDGTIHIGLCIYQKFSKGGGMCRCKKAMETSGHVLHECQCDANSLTAWPITTWSQEADNPTNAAR
jgi:hypothetical protein